MFSYSAAELGCSSVFNKSDFLVNLSLFKPMLVNVFDYSGVFLDMRQPKIVCHCIHLHIFEFLYV